MFHSHFKFIFIRSKLAHFTNDKFGYSDVGDNVFSVAFKWWQIQDVDDRIMMLAIFLQFHQHLKSITNIQKSTFVSNIDIAQT